MTDTSNESELTETQKAYNVAQYELFQLAAYGHYTHAPLTDTRTGKYLSIREIEAGQQDYNDRIRQAREQLEAAVLNLVAEKAETLRGDWGVMVAWLRSLAADPTELSLLAAPREEEDSR
ncbi:hypothetical protein [Streptomyces lavendofoliae]|uniref:Uncharacterized protein n=1 Tax=Streptomyces lavendofoliae TaxID=67314 RepID=A0A918I2L2_9ACTN|nr:hypothetical protein [Streptomyces lavendofoliae]GGU62388.1 hypothetical protein GCM10010274_58960 [Streptomyces lavendofoliae]